jgi:hypothetical protein
MRNKYTLPIVLALALSSCAGAAKPDKDNQFIIESFPAATVRTLSNKLCDTPCSISIEESKQELTFEWKTGKRIVISHPRATTPEAGMIFFGDGALVKISPRLLSVKLLDADDSLNDNYKR